MAQVIQSNAAHLHGQSANAASHQSNGSSTHPAPEDSQTGGVDNVLSTTQPDSAEATKIQNSLKARKRTKTGCLSTFSSRFRPLGNLNANIPTACRKRRIKCGEERPTCANCIKSKRGCEGYAPRLTFKDPLGAFRPGWAMKGHGAHYQNYSGSNGALGHYTRQPAPSGAQNQLPVIAPRPLPTESSSDVYHPSDIPPIPWSAGLHHSAQQSPPSHLQPSNDLPPRMRQMYQKQTNPSGNGRDHVETEEITGDFSTTKIPPMLQPQSYNQENMRALEGRPSVPQWQSSTTANGSVKEEHVHSSADVAIQYLSPLHDRTPQDYYQDIRAEDTNHSFDNLVSAKPPPMQSPQNFQLQQDYQYAIPPAQGTSIPAQYAWSAGTNSVPYNEDDFSKR